MPRKDVEPLHVDNLADLMDLARTRAAMTGKHPFEALVGTKMTMSLPVRKSKDGE